MNPVAPRRKGWCPGALRPMETGDGLLARVRTSGGRLTLDQAAAIAEAALACGNGAISLSARGNLQVRGVSERTLPELQARLGDAGLIDSDPEVERLRNILASPLSDIDQAAALDLAPHVAALEARLAEDRSLRPLPAKFSFVLDADGRLPVGDIDADIRFEAARERWSGRLSRPISPATTRLPASAHRPKSRTPHRVSPGPFFRSPARAKRATPDARPRRARRRQGRVRRGRARGEATPAGSAPRVARRRAGRSRLRRGDRRRRCGAVRRHRGGPSQDAHCARAGAWGERSAARALAIVVRDRPCAEGGGVLGRRLREAWLHHPFRRPAASRRRLPRRARLHARASPVAGRCDALGAASARGRGRRSACERLRQRLRQARSDGGDADRDRERV